jgi:hypothetical protein
MYRHVALFRWADGTTDEDVRRVSDGLSTLPGLIPAIRAYTFGPDIGGTEGHWDFAVVADFDDRAGWQAYQEHPEHQRIVAEAIVPIRRERASLQFEVHREDGPRS